MAQEVTKRLNGTVTEVTFEVSEHAVYTVTLRGNGWGTVSFYFREEATASDIKMKWGDRPVGTWVQLTENDAFPFKVPASCDRVKLVASGLGGGAEILATVKFSHYEHKSNSFR